jgi:hypothetical protein
MGAGQNNYFSFYEFLTSDGRLGSNESSINHHRTQSDPTDPTVQLNIASHRLLTDDGMKIITKRIEYQPVRGAPIDVPTAIHAVVAVLDPGTQLSTITSYLSENQQDGVVRAVMLAPELNLAQKLLPFKNMVRQNPASIGNTLPLAIQEVLNQEETDKDPSRPRPISKGEFSLSNRGDIGGI